MDAALRIKEINAAREKIGADPYLGTDRGIKESFKYGICEELVKDSPDYDKVLLELELAEAERLRIAREKREEEERIARAKREEQERIRLQEVEKAQKKRRAAIQKDLGNPGLSVTEVKFNADYEKLMVEFKCEVIEGYPHKVVVQFKKRLGCTNYCRERSTGPVAVR